MCGFHRQAACASKNIEAEDQSVSCLLVWSTVRASCLRLRLGKFSSSMIGLLAFVLLDN